MLFDTPILFITYKRFYTARKVFDVIKKIKPKKLYFASNLPPKKNYKKDIESVYKVRSLLNEVNWNCKVKKIFHGKHLRVSESIPRSIDIFFKNEKEGIILEDDCLPSIDFFSYCKKMLKIYKNKNINAICGSRFVPEDSKKEIYFSKYNHAWGWATWKKSWNNFDPKIKFWKNYKNSKHWQALNENIERKYWEKIFDKTFSNQIDTWDYAWTASAWYKKQLSIIPPVNLISNIGFGPEATWTLKSKNDKVKKPKKLKNFRFKSKEVTRNVFYDNQVFLKHFKGNRQSVIMKTKDHINLLISDPKTFFLKAKRNLKNV